VNTAQVGQTAVEIESMSDTIRSILETDKNALNKLSNWQGQAAEKIKGSINKFITRNYDKIPTVFKHYTQFLFQNVAEDYAVTEKTNIDLSSLFR
jgi:hypothetical protein